MIGIEVKGRNKIKMNVNVSGGAGSSFTWLTAALQVLVGASPIEVHAREEGKSGRGFMYNSRRSQLAPRTKSSL